MQDLHRLLQLKQKQNQRSPKLHKFQSESQSWARPQTAGGEGRGKQRQTDIPQKPGQRSAFQLIGFRLQQGPGPGDSRGTLGWGVGLPPPVDPIGRKPKALGYHVNPKERAAHRCYHKKLPPLPRSSRSPLEDLAAAGGPLRKTLESCPPHGLGVPARPRLGRRGGQL